MVSWYNISLASAIGGSLQASFFLQSVVCTYNYSCKFWPLHFRDYYSSSTLLLLSILLVQTIELNLTIDVYL